MKELKDILGTISAGSCDGRGAVYLGGVFVGRAAGRCAWISGMHELLKGGAKDVIWRAVE